MENNVIIPAKENKQLLLGVRITQREKVLIDEFCKVKKVNKTDLVRFAIKQIIPTF